VDGGGLDGGGLDGSGLDGGGLDGSGLDGSGLDGSGLDGGGLDLRERGSGVLLVRGWLQNGVVVARLRWALPDDAEQQVAVVVGAQEVQAAVGRFLDGLVGTAPDGDSPST
jgi:hypothetical protein